MSEHPDIRWDDLLEPEISVSAVMDVPIEELGVQELTGERFGKYLLVGEIATGGMAEVFLAVHKGPEGFVKIVVIKRVLQHLTSNPDFVQMFINEARLAARLEHPNIVRTYEFGEVDGQYFTAMEYLPGEDLCKTLNKLSISKQQMPLHFAAGIISQVCAGLHFAHQLTDTDGRPLELVHRDINPANIVLTYGGEVKIIDFGVAKSSANQHTITGTIKGKIAYMPPEQVLSRAVDQRADVFSAGIVLWELITGRPLFLRDSDAATLYAVMNDQIPPPSKHRSDVPRELDHIVLRALARAPSARYASADQLAAALDDFMARAPRYDARMLAGTVENLFGSTRAEAKRSIAQTRSLARNITLVMKLRSEVRADLAERLDAVDRDRAGDDAGEPAPGQRGLLAVLAAVLVACIAAGVLYTMSRPAPAQIARPVAATALAIDSVPAGAAVFVDGEPTGLTTPATLTGLTAGRFAIRVELSGHAPAAEEVDVPTGLTAAAHLTLRPLPGRLVLAGLPADATVFVDDEEHAAGDVIAVPAGRHVVRVIAGGRTLDEQTIVSGAGDQLWKLAQGKLVPN